MLNGALQQVEESYTLIGKQSSIWYSLVFPSLVIERKVILDNGEEALKPQFEAACRYQI